MILSVRAMSYEQLRDTLNEDDRVVVLACNNCAKKCLGLGGRAGMKALSDKLESDGYRVVRELIGFGCAVDLVGKRGKDEATRQDFEDADVIVPLSCEDGEVAARMAFPGKRVPSINKTLGIGWASPSCGVRLTHCVSGVDLRIDSDEGIPLEEAAERLGCEFGPF